MHSVARKITATLSITIATLFPSFSFIYYEQDITVEISCYPLHIFERREEEITRGEQIKSNGLMEHVDVPINALRFYSASLFSILV